jgi:hypothetical protein
MLPPTLFVMILALVQVKPDALKPFSTSGIQSRSSVECTFQPSVVGDIDELSTVAHLCLLPLGILLPLSWRLDRTDRRLRALSRIDAKLDLLLKHAGIEYVPYSDLPPNVIDALKRGYRIIAIKHYRHATKVGLKEAKKVIEDVQRVAGI